MEHAYLLKRLQQEIKQTSCDIKAETLLALALAHGLSTADFMIACSGFFYREYSNDLLFSEMVDDIAKKPYLQVNLSRSGIYDQLPEGLFYQPDKTITQPLDAASMAAECRRNKKKEQEIRRFFMPFENEIFHQRIQLEHEEIRLLQGFHSGILGEYFIGFWGISPHLPLLLVTPLIGLLPYVHHIAGNSDLTGHCLQSILKEQVSVRNITGWNTPVPANQVCELGKQCLGVDMVSSKQFSEDHTVMEFTIGPLKNSVITDYLQGGNRAEFLEIFYSFFVPADAEVTTVITVGRPNKQMRLQTIAAPVLGYTSIL